MISYRKDPMAAAPQSQLHYCVHCTRLIFQSQRKKNKACEYLHSDDVLASLKFWVTNLGKGKKQRIERILAILCNLKVGSFSPIMNS